MKRKIQSKFALALAILFTIFTLPVNGLAASAEDNGYDDIADGTYDITAKAMDANEDKESAAAGFINEKAKLSVKEGKTELTISIPQTDGVEMEGIQIEGIKPKVEKEEGVEHFTYQLNNLKTKKEEIDFDTVKEEDSSMKKDETKVKQKGEKGEKEVEYEVTYKNDEEINRKQINEKVTKEPIDKEIIVGTGKNESDVTTKED